MTFWQENYGFVKEVYDFRMAKYQEWMDNLEGIVNKVLTPNVQYTYKEFKTIQDSLNSLCRDLEKEGMKEWLDMMLEKVAMRVSEEGWSARDKEFKSQERKRLQAMIERHNKLMPPTKETQEKVEIYARCYAFADEIGQTMKTLDEMKHLSTKTIHPHNMNMVEELIEKAEKVSQTVSQLSELSDDYIKRGERLIKTPNCAPFLIELLEKLEIAYREARETSKERLELLTKAAKDWEKYDDMRSSIMDPIEKLENDFKKYRKSYDPVFGEKKLAQKVSEWESLKAKSDEMFENIKRCYGTIVVIAGAEKKDFLDREISEIKEKLAIMAKCDTKLKELKGYNDKLMKAVQTTKGLHDWAHSAGQKLKELMNKKQLKPEDRTREILILNSEARKKMPQIEPLLVTYRSLIQEDDLEHSETARTTMREFEETRKSIHDLMERMDKETSDAAEDERRYAEYLSGLKDFKPWISEAEGSTQKKLEKPTTLADAMIMLNNCKDFQGSCTTNKVMLDCAGKAREDMDRKLDGESEIDPLVKRWANVKKVAEDRVSHATILVATWNQLQETTQEFSTRLGDVPNQLEPNMAELEVCFNSMKRLASKKKELLGFL